MRKLQEAGSKDINIFHRTGSSRWTPTEMESHVEEIKKGFEPSFGDMYGKGLYGADWNTQMKDGEGHMNGYGPIILHYVANSKGYLILDYRLSKRLYGGGYSLEDQLTAYGVYSKKDLPSFLSVMSEDLDDTFKYPRISADRANWLAEFFYRGKPLQNYRLKYSPIKSIQDAYFTTMASFRKEPFNAKIKSGLIKGMVFSGNHDGNVIVTYPPSFKKLIFVGWCVAKGNQIIKPWDYVGGNTTAAGLTGQYQNGIAKLLDSKPGKEVAGISWSGNLTNNTLDDAIKKTLDSLYWLDNSLARFKDLDVSVNNNGIIVKSGIWINGECLADQFDDGAVFNGGIFTGDIFEGNFKSGTFAKGVFKGTFSGGIYVLCKETAWDKSAQLGTGGARAIKVDNKIYP